MAVKHSGKLALLIDIVERSVTTGASVRITPGDALDPLIQHSVGAREDGDFVWVHRVNRTIANGTPYDMDLAADVVDVDGNAVSPTEVRGAILICWSEGRVVKAIAHATNGNLAFGNHASGYCLATGRGGIGIGTWVGPSVGAPGPEVALTGVVVDGTHKVIRFTCETSSEEADVTILLFGD